MLAMTADDDRARKAFAKFLEVHSLSGRAISKAAGLSPSAASQFIRGNSQSPKSETIRKFANAATDLLGRTVSVPEITGDKRMQQVFEDWGGPLEASDRRTPIRHYVGAGDEVHVVDDQHPIGHTPSPPGFERERGAAVVVRGDSMRPLFEPGDMLFFRQRFTPPASAKQLPLRPVIVQIKGGALYVKKLLPGTSKGRFHLISLSPLTTPMQDQAVESFAHIEWVRPKLT